MMIFRRIPQGASKAGAISRCKSDPGTPEQALPVGLSQAAW